MKAESSAPPPRILVVDDDAELAGTLQEFLEQEGYLVDVAFSAAEAMAIQERNPHLAVALIDLIMPLTDGITLMEQLHGRDPELAVIIMTGFGTIETAVEAMKHGAEDYVTKPFDRQAVRKKIARLMEVVELRQRVEQLEASLDSAPSFRSFTYASPLMQRVLERARVAAITDAPILILGETGTGKEMLARAIHGASPYGRRPFVPVNCGALPRELVESELFGVRRGAFTGAYTDAPGIFTAASGGTVFLDEIGEMPKEAQVKLLRVLQEGELRSVGSPKAVKVNVRVIAASNRPLAELRSGRLRDDLYFRVATVVVELPPLRSRREDILVLAKHFTDRLSRRYGRELVLARSALDLLVNYPFPGNVRELENILESIMATSLDDPQTINDRDLKPLLSESINPGEAPPFSSQPPLSPPLSMEQLEHMAIRQALRVCRGNRSKAATMLGISRDTLYRRLRRYGSLAENGR